MSEMHCTLETSWHISYYWHPGPRLLGVLLSLTLILLPFKLLLTKQK